MSSSSTTTVLRRALDVTFRKRPVRSLGMTGIGIGLGYGTWIEYHANHQTTSTTDIPNTIAALPRDYDRQALHDYWNHRPMTVLYRLGQVMYELGPCLGMYMYDFQWKHKTGGKEHADTDNNDNTDKNTLGNTSMSPTSNHYKTTMMERQRRPKNDDPSENDKYQQQQQLQQKQQEEALQRHHAIRLRTALTNLGPAFVKAGQQLSIRPDLVPAVVLKELQQLCDAVQPIPDHEAIAVLQQELSVQQQCHDDEKIDLNKIFQDLQLVASASLGQVYSATLVETGEKVAIKVQRPDIRRTFSLDLYLLQLLGIVMDQVVTTLTFQSPYHLDLFNTFSMGSYAELDYEKEAANQIFFRTELAKRQCKVKVPRVYEQYTTERVLCSEWIVGIRLADAPKEQIRALIPDGVELFLIQLLDFGRFHADPHPGNLYVTTTNNENMMMSANDDYDDERVLCLLDFGLCSDISESARTAMTKAIVHLLTGDFDALVAQDAKDLGFLPPDYNVKELQPILQTILTKGLLESGSNLHHRKRKLMEISNELNDVFFRYPFSVPPFFALVTRGLGLLEGIALTGDPDFDIFQAALPYARKRAIKIMGGGDGSGGQSHWWKLF